MPFLLLVCLSLACLPIAWPRPQFFTAPWQSAVATAVVTLGMLLGARRVATKTRRLLKNSPADGLHYHGQRRTLHAFGLLAAFVVVLYCLGWAWAVQSTLCGWLNRDTVPPGAELLILAPLPLMMAGSWVFFYDAERAVHTAGGTADAQPFGGRFGYLGFQVRQNLALVSAPVLIMILTQGLTRAFPATFQDDFAQGLLMTPFAGAAVLFMPLGLRILLNLKPLPVGPMRDRLEAAARRLKCRCSDILVWNTRNGMANAMVVGVVPQLRYILLSDKLLEEMTPEEVEAVFGHEAGHVKHYHMGYYLVFLTASLAVLAKVTGLVEARLDVLGPTAVWLKSHANWLALPSLAVVVAYVFGVFGYLSRRCERQADVYGCKAVSCGDPACPGHSVETTLAPGGEKLCPEGVRVFCSALDKVAALNGVSRTRPGWLHSWQHSTIAKRVAFLQQLGTAPATEPRFQRGVWRLKVALLAGVAVAATVVWLVG